MIKKILIAVAILHLLPALILPWLLLFELIEITSGQFGALLTIAIFGIVILMLPIIYEDVK